MSLSVISIPEKKPTICTIVGDGGLGKTSLAADFPGPVVFIRTEDGVQSIAGRKDIAMFPIARNSEMVLKQIEELITEEHNFKTLVIDTVTQLHVLIEAKIIKEDGKAKSINTAMGGYGAGHSACANEHRMIREDCGYLSEKKGMNIVFLAHCDTDTVDLPDQEPFSRYTMRINKKSISQYTDNVDLVGFIKLKTYTTGDENKKKAISDGSRIITCYPTPSHISKNRYGIEEDLLFEKGKNPLLQFIGE